MKMPTEILSRPSFNSNPRAFESANTPQSQQTNTKDDYRVFFECGRVEIKAKTE